MHLRKEALMSVFGGLMLNFVLGANITWTSSVLPKLTNATSSPFGRVIDKEEAGWITSIMGIGAIFGTHIFGYLSNKIGKKVTFLLAGVPCMVSNIMIYYAHSVEVYILARFICGLSVATIYTFPSYIAELTHKNIRAVICTLCSCTCCGGLLFSNAIGPFISISNFSLVLAGIPAIYLIYFAIFGQEVPHYYLMRDDEFLARKAIEKLRGGYEDIDETFDEIKNKYVEEKSGKLKDLYSSKPLLKGFVTITTLLIFHQLTGMIAIMFYGQNLIQNVSSELSPEISVILLSIVIFLSSVLSPPLTSKFPNKTLLIFSGTGMFLMDIVMGIYTYTDQHYKLSPSLSSIPLICLTVFITMYSIGFGPLPYVILGEIFPSRVKSVATSGVSLIVGIVAFILTKYFMYMVETLGAHGYYIFCAFCCFLAIIFTKFYLIETKNKSLEQIQFELSL